MIARVLIAVMWVGMIALTLMGCVSGGYHHRKVSNAYDAGYKDGYRAAVEVYR